MAVPRSIRYGFWNGEERRLRMPWRLLVTAVLLSVGTAVAANALTIGATVFGLDLAMGVEVVSVFTLISLLAVGGILWIVASVIDRRPYRDYGLRLDRDWWVDTGFGLALGAALPTALFLVGWLAGWLRVTGFAGGGFAIVRSMLVLAVLFVAVGLLEELLVRGWLLTNLAEGFRWLGDRWAVVLAVLLSSVTFGVLHLGNPGATPRSAAGISLAGILLGLGYVLTGELGVPVGVHVSWNFFLGPIYGFPVSGLTIRSTVVETRSVGPDLLTGGAFGPEAGLLGVGAVLLGMVAVGWWAKRRIGWIAPDPRIPMPPRR